MKYLVIAENALERVNSLKAWLLNGWKVVVEIWEKQNPARWRGSVHILLIEIRKVNVDQPL
jgi:hypothetical protein